MCVGGIRGETLNKNAFVDTEAYLAVEPTPIFET